MIAGFFLALWQLILPITLITYALVGWMLHRGHLPSFADRKEMRDHLKATKAAMKKDKPVDNPLLKRWMGFGGGFYGLVAMYTFFLFEPPIIFNFARGLIDPENWSIGGLIELAIGFIINSIKQLIEAALWFFYWFADMEALAIIITAVLLYVSYVMASRLARQHHEANTGHMRLWHWLDEDKTETEGQSDPDM